MLWGASHMAQTAQKPILENAYTASEYDKNGVHINEAIDFFCEHLLQSSTDKKKENISWQKKFQYYYPPAWLINAIKKSIEGGTDTEKLAEALKEVAKTPTGRMAIWTTITNENQRLGNPQTISDTKQAESKIVLHSKAGSGDPSWWRGYINFARPHDVHVLQDRIEEDVKKSAKTYRADGSLPAESLTSDALERAALFNIGTLFLHEMQHVRQVPYLNDVGDLYGIYMDAAPQALSTQLRVESNNPLLQKMYNIPTSAVQAYEKAVDYDPKTGAVDVQKATRYSHMMQQRYTIDFASDITAQKAPWIDYTMLYSRWHGYIASKFNFILDQPSTDSQKRMQDYLRMANRVSVRVGDPLPQKVKDIFSPLIQGVKKTASEEEITHINKCIDREEKLDPSEFKGGEKSSAYQKAKAFMDAYLDLNKQLYEISRLSRQIHEGKKTDADGNPLLPKAQKIRAYLSKKYGIKLHTHNRLGERIATDVESDGVQIITKEGKVKPTSNATEHVDVRRALARAEKPKTTPTPALQRLPDKSRTA